jgi:hypothetical protein
MVIVSVSKGLLERIVLSNNVLKIVAEKDTVKMALVFVIPVILD